MSKPSRDNERFSFHGKNDADWQQVKELEFERWMSLSLMQRLAEMAEVCERAFALRDAHELMGETLDE